MSSKEFHRRSIRIPGGDYTQGGGYFITICAANKHSIFGKIERGKVALTPLGEIVRRCWMEIPEHFCGAALKEFVVMPSHLHGIIVLAGARPGDGREVEFSVVGARYIVPLDRRAGRSEEFQKPVRGSIPTIVRTFKAEVTRRAARELTLKGRAIWQRNYFERVLRNGQEYASASRYIIENPMRWEKDVENPNRKAGPDCGTSMP